MVKPQTNVRSFVAAVALLALAAIGTIIYAASVGGYTANRELGQIDFIHYGPNQIKATGLHYPYAIAIDESVSPNRVYVADNSNGRVLGWADVDEFNGGAPADLVIGKSDFSTSNCNLQNPSANELCSPLAVSVDPSGNLYVADAGMVFRVLAYLSPFQSGYTTGQAAVMQINAGVATGLANDSFGNLYVSNQTQDEVLEFNSPLVANGEQGSGDTTPDLIIGGGGCDNTATDLCAPWGLFVDSQNNLWVADSGNHRVAEFNAPAATGNTSANLILTGPITPYGVTLDSTGNVFVTDKYESRVLGYAAPVSSSSAPATVFGQGGSFQSGDPNQGGVSASSLNLPIGIATDSKSNLYVVDQDNNRILRYITPFTTTSTPGSGDTVADSVYGQHDFVNVVENNEDGYGLAFWRNLEIPTVSPPMLEAPDFSWLPGSVAIDRSSTPNHLYITDSANNRILGYNDAHALANDAPADIVIGQTDFQSANASSGWCAPASATTLCDPQSAAVDASGNLWVADTWNNRVLEFPQPFSSGLTAGMAATLVLGQTNMQSDAGGLGPAAFSMPIGVALDPAGNAYVADGFNNRVLEFNQPAETGQSANLVFGQSGSFSTDGCNQGGESADSLCFYLFPATFPSLGGSLATDASGNLWVADSENSRVLVYYAPLSASKSAGMGDTTADLVFGTGGVFTAPAQEPTPSSSSFSGPDGIAFDSAGNLYVADVGYSRVLEFDSPLAVSPPNTSADRVYGQPDFTTVAGHGDATAADLSSPVSAAIDDQGSLYIADSGFNRVTAIDQPLLPTPLAPTATPSPTPTPVPTNIPVHLSIKPGSLSFGKVALGSMSEPQAVFITNPGKKPLSVDIEMIETSGPFQMINNGCATMIPSGVLMPGKQCSTSIAFAPVRLGHQSGKLIISDNTRHATSRVPLSGFGKK